MADLMQTVAAMACIKSLLMIFNLAFWATGLGVLCMGVWMQVEMNKYLMLSGEYSDFAPYILVATGSLIIMISSLACCCTVKGHPTLLYLYGGFLGVILVVELACATSMYAYKDRIASGFDKGLNDSMIQYEADDVIIVADFDLMQGKLECCGNNGYKDWSNLPRPMPVPKSCCLPNNLNCDVQDETQIYRDGCYDRVVNLIDDNMSLIGAVAVMVSLFPIVGIVLTCCMAANITKAKYEQMA